MKYIALLALLLSAHANAQCFGPAGCNPDYAPPASGPTLLCLPEGCNVVSYSEINHFTVAESVLPNGYPVMGWSGPCLSGDCPDIRNQAFADLELNAKRANRAQRF
jgi:hypothetical protein